MTFNFLFTIVLILIIFAVITTIKSILWAKDYGVKENSDFRDSDGDHIYYDRAVIEKKRFFRMHPRIPENEVRSLHRLLNFFQGKEKS